MPSQNNDAMADNAGFTLVEMLVTLALIALLATVMTGATMQMRSISVISQRNDANLEFEALGNYLDKLIANAALLPLIQNDSQQLQFFDGGPDRIRLISVIRTGSGQLNLRQIELNTRTDGNLLDLVQTSSPRRLNGSMTEPAPSISAPTLVTNLKSVSFEYLGATSESVSNRSDWQHAWSEPGRLPRAVRITISAERARQVVNLDHIINLKLAD